MIRTLASTVLAVTLVACATTPGAVAPANSEEIRVYVYYAGNPTPEPAAGATVFVLGTDNRVIKSVTADRDGVATFPILYDQPTTKYFLAELSPLLVAGVRWSPGRREYNLPLFAEPLVNRAIIKTP